MAVTARISKSGQVTIPAEIRERLGLKPGDTVVWGQGSSGEATVRAVKYTFEDLRGVVPGLDTDRDLSEIIGEARNEWGEKKVREYEEIRTSSSLTRTSS
jgi:bifunctional DNA-binding transcriptional regulator/antitoxin component of YhaV-PrlF toxin-antitoxin module